jgi:hypothetical protein
LGALVVVGMRSRRDTLPPPGHDTQRGCGRNT